MTCEESKALMSLDRELSMEEKARLTGHAQACDSCASQLASVVRLRTLITSIASKTPDIPNAEALTADILVAVSRLRRPANRPWLDRFLRLTDDPIFRFSYALLVLVSIGMYGLVELRSLTDVGRLAERMSQQPHRPRISYVVPREALAGVIPPDLLRRFSSDSNQMITVDRAILEQGIGRLERPGIASFQVTSVLGSRPLREAVDVLTKALFPKIRFVRSNDHS